MPSTRVWFITGASRGLGKAFTEAALAAGDRVVAAARDLSPLADLRASYPDRIMLLTLDVRDPTAVQQVVDEAAAAFGRLDIVVNNAGTMLLGMVEEATEAQIRDQFEVNFFGAVWVTQAVVPHLRSQGFGHIVQVTSMGTGGGFASTGFYAASKSALDSVSQALAMEVAPFGITVTIVQPGSYGTDLFTRGTTATTPRAEYAPLRTQLSEMWGEDVGPAPSTAAPVVMELADLPEPPSRLIVGAASFDMVEQMEAARRSEYDAWKHLSVKAPG
ncbi:SDR family NAD(P)-dependent oxidoreductase [Gordonia sp. OPL2]|uniref:SDR family NAD(P)-dependent oxidoreductase n=1 Tax=Gordonia sp. OPL2 TaxID=2486274 RepID=UPI0016550153|nr:SDR family NAD(P)-dependent oxidoreductase [Gordonia sp. OPL2]